MSCHFSANQFEKSFKPRCLGNWEVPKLYPSHPEARQETTKIIANDRGHLLPGIAKPNGSPWGQYVGTWQLPKRITREVANQISQPASGSALRRNKDKKSKRRTDPRQEAVGETQQVLGEDHQQAGVDFCKASETDAAVKEELDLEYVPGDITEHRHRHPNRELLLQQKYLRKHNKQHKHKLNDLYVEKHECQDLVEQLNEAEYSRREEIPHVLGDNTDVNCDLMKIRRDVTEKPGDRGPPSPIVPAYCNFEAARKMHSDNLEHQPLPDAVADKAYRKLQAQGGFNPGIALDVIPQVAGVGVKSYKAGPTQCTKLRVYRPKTCGIVPKPLDQSHYSNRPQTSLSKKDMGAMDLAICWDYRPFNPSDEPQPPKHIDGSNGSSAPAIFTLVKTPRSPNQKLETGRSGGVFLSTQGEGTFFDRDVVRQHQYFQKKHAMERTCECGNSAKSVKENIYRPRSNSRTTEIDEGKLQKRCKSSPNLSILANPSQQKYHQNSATNGQRCFHDNGRVCLPPKSAEKKHRHHNHHHRRRSSDECEHIKNPRMCQQSNHEANDKPIEKVSYKQAFKAGIPNSNSSGTCTSFDSGCSSMTPATNISIPKMNIPKPRNPYAKKDYTISTLVPPFACWKGGAGQGGYPEHWRLASVYQHAYKPVEQRRRPLLATVYQ